MKPNSSNRTEESINKEKNLAKKAKDELKKLILNNKLIYVSFDNYDKYGRPLVTLYENENITEKSINQQMLDLGFGKSYFGGHKENFD